MGRSKPAALSSGFFGLGLRDKASAHVITTQSTSALGAQVTVAPWTLPQQREVVPQPLVKINSGSSKFSLEGRTSWWGEDLVLAALTLSWRFISPLGSLYAELSHFWSLGSLLILIALTLTDTTWSSQIKWDIPKTEGVTREGSRENPTSR